MKLLFCPVCQDVLRLRAHIRFCDCKKSYGRYIDSINAIIGGRAIPIGFANRSLVRALENRPKAGLGERFDAFVIPELCDSVEQCDLVEKVKHKSINMTDKEIIEFLKTPYIITGTEKSKKRLCSCGQLQTHRLRWCSDCGREFNIDPTKVPICQVIYMQCHYNTYRQQDNGNNGYKWFEAIYRRQLGRNIISLDRFRALCEEAKKQYDNHNSKKKKESRIMDINGYKLKLTCSACPEQYDVFKDDKIVGYLRLRHGHFSVEYPDCGGELVYEAQPKGDGIFEDDERDKYLTNAINAIDYQVKSNVK